MDKKAIILSFIFGLVLGDATISQFTSTKKVPEQVSEEITLEDLRVKNLRIDKINGKSFESLCINPDSEPVQGVKVEELDATKLKVRESTDEDIRKSLRSMPQHPIQQLQLDFNRG